jgi:hypothetical protein
MSSSGNLNLTTLRQTPLTCSGHTRPVVFLAFSDYNEEDAANYFMISACKGNNKYSSRILIVKYIKKIIKWLSLSSWYCSVIIIYRLLRQHSLVAKRHTCRMKDRTNVSGCLESCLISACRGYYLMIIRYYLVFIIISWLQR